MTNRPHNWRPIGTRYERGYGLKHDRIRRALLRDEPWCRECAKAGKEVKATHADHITPRCLNGPDDRHNYQPLCEPCSRAKSSREGAMMRHRKRGHLDRGN